MALSHSRTRFAEMLHPGQVNPDWHGLPSSLKCLYSGKALDISPSGQMAMFSTSERFEMTPEEGVFT